MRIEFQHTVDDLKEAEAAAQHGPEHVSRRWYPWQGLFGWVLFIGLAIMLFVLLRRGGGRGGRPAAAPITPDLFPDKLLAIVPWLLIFGFIWFFVFQQLRRQVNQRWERTPSLHRPQTVTADAEGLSWNDPLVQTRYRWEVFTKFAETPRLFLLDQEGIGWHFIPKRAFPDEAALSAFRELLQRSVGETRPGFPVVPLRQ